MAEGIIYCPKDRIKVRKETRCPGETCETCSLAGVLSKTQERHPKLTRKAATRGVKQKRDPMWGLFKPIIETIVLRGSPRFIYDCQRSLIRTKNAHLENEIPHDPVRFYVRHCGQCQYLKLSLDLENSSRGIADLIREHALEMDQWVVSTIESLKKYLELIPATMKRYPASEGWFIEYFGRAIARYLPDWQTKIPADWEKKTAQARYDFGRGWMEITEFVALGKTSRELGYTREGWHHFNQKYGIQGRVALLGAVDDLLYGDVEVLSQKETRIRRLWGELMTLLDHEDDDIARAAIKQLCFNRWPPGCIKLPPAARIKHSKKPSSIT